jgi:ribosomal protein L35AE/L33A
MKALRKERDLNLKRTYSDEFKTTIDQPRVMKGEIYPPHGGHGHTRARYEVSLRVDES